MRNLLILGIVLSAVFFVSCDKNDTVVVNTVTSSTVNSLPADTIIGLANGQPYGAGKFTFFSLTNNKVVASTDSNSVNWDIAFRGTTILTNGGTSGPGGGGAFVYTGTFDALTSIPADSSFKVDNAPTAYAITTGSNKGWYVYDYVNNLITPIPGRVLVIRTATGKYAKVEILNYYKNGITPAATASDTEKTNNQRYYTFRFSYQSNGTKVF